MMHAFQQRAARIASIAKQKKDAERQQQGNARQKEEEAKKAARREKLLRADAHAYETMLPKVREWAASGDKRYGRRQELQLLL